MADTGTEKEEAEGAYKRTSKNNLRSESNGT